MDFLETTRLLKKYKVPFVRTILAKSRSELKNKLKNFSYPVVVKAFSTKGIHKTGKGLIFLDVLSEKEAVASFNRIKSRMKPFEGVLVQEQLDGIELVIGGKSDHVFGSVIMFGLGGVLVEAFREVVFRLAPLSKKEALNMIKNTRVFALLNSKRVNYNLDLLLDLIVKTSYMLSKEKIQELDFNPVILTENKAWVVDVRVTFQ